MRRGFEGQAHDAEERSKLEEMDRKMRQAADTLRAEGHVFEIEDNQNEFVIKIPATAGAAAREVHLSKKDPFPLLNGSGKLTLDFGIEEVLRAEITRPGENVYDAVRSARTERSQDS